MVRLLLKMKVLTFFKSKIPRFRLVQTSWHLKQMTIIESTQDQPSSQRCSNLWITRLAAPNYFGRHTNNRKFTKNSKFLLQHSPKHTANSCNRLTLHLEKNTYPIRLIWFLRLKTILSLPNKKTRFSTATICSLTQQHREYTEKSLQLNRRMKSTVS